MFRNPIRRVDIIYTFLDEKAMNMLKPYLKNLMKTGTRVVSLTYEIPDVKPTHVFDAYEDIQLALLSTLASELTDKLREYKIYVYA